MAKNSGLIVSAFFGLTVASFALGGLEPAQAQQRGGVSQAERQQQISKLIEDINGPDPAARIAAYEAAVRNTDRTLARLAIQTALNTQDQVLREDALAKALAARRSVMIQLTARANQPVEQAAINAIGGRIEMFLLGFNQETGAFSAATPYSSGNRNNSNVMIFRPSPASVQGDRMSFSFDLQGGYTDQPDWSFRATNARGDPANYLLTACAGNLVLGQGTLLTGTLSCQSGANGGEQGNLAFGATVNVLN